MKQFTVRSITDRTYWQSIAHPPQTSKLLEAAASKADQVPPRLPTPAATDYLAAIRTNDRGRLDHHWHDTRIMLQSLVARRLRDGMQPDDHLLNWIFDYTFEPCWMVSAHIPGRELPLAGYQQLDLAATELAAGLAEMREALHPWLREQSGTLHQSIINEIDRRCLTPFVDGQPEWWMTLDDPRHPINNWSGVCGGSILTACLSLEAQGFPRPAARKRSIEIINAFFRQAFGETGECDEGPGYWNYGVTYGCMPLMRMSEGEIADNFDLARIRQVASYPERAHIYGNCFFASNDSGSRLSASPTTATWLAHLTGSDFIRWWLANYPGTPNRTIYGLLRDLHYATQPAPASAVAPKQHPARLLKDQQVAIFQRPGPNALFTFTLGGGHNAESHNHNDLGTFQILLDDVAWILDLGQPQYQTDFFSDVRYTKYMSAASSGHCCPQINGFEQRPGREAQAQILAYNPDAGHFALDCTLVYPAEAALERWTREVTVPPAEASALLADRYTLRKDGRIIHRIWFREKPTVQGQVITCGPVQARTDPAPEQTAILEFACDDPRLLLRERTPDGKVYRLDLTYRCQASRLLEIRTSMSADL